MKKLFRYFFNLIGLEVTRKPVPPQQYGYTRNEQMIQGLHRCRQRNINVNTIVDIGAAAGSWSLSARELWPECNYMLFEPLEERKAELEKLTTQFKKFHFIPAAAGSQKSTVKFRISNDLDGSGVADGYNEQVNTRTVEVVSIDDEVQRLQLKGPFIIKLDTHGFEVPILQGAVETLKAAELLIIEVYGFKLTAECLLFHELSMYLDNLGFRLVDLVDLMRREKDNAFWQADAFYIRKDHAIFKDNAYN